MDTHDMTEVALGLAGICTALLGWLVMNISELNKNIAVVVSRVDSHEKRLDHVEDVILTGPPRPIEGA